MSPLDWHRISPMMRYCGWLRNLAPVNRGKHPIIIPWNLQCFIATFHSFQLVKDSATIHRIIHIPYTIYTVPCIPSIYHPYIIHISSIYDWYIPSQDIPRLDKRTIGWPQSMRRWLRCDGLSVQRAISASLAAWRNALGGEAPFRGGICGEIRSGHPYESLWMIISMVSYCWIKTMMGVSWKNRGIDLKHVIIWYINWWFFRSHCDFTMKTGDFTTLQTGRCLGFRVHDFQTNLANKPVHQWWDDSWH